jgi:hypothetical protein
MSCLGIHFALTEKAVSELIRIRDKTDRIAFVQEIEEAFLSDHKTYAAESDKSWDAMHRLLSDGLLTWDGGEYPLSHVILAGRLLYTGDDYIMSLKSPSQVRDIATALRGLEEEE